MEPCTFMRNWTCQVPMRIPMIKCLIVTLSRLVKQYCSTPPRQEPYWIYSVGLLVVFEQPLSLARCVSPPAPCRRCASPASGSSPSPACTRTGCGITIRPPDATSRPIRWGWSMGRVFMGMRGRTRGGGRTRGEAAIAVCAALGMSVFCGLIVRKIAQICVKADIVLTNAVVATASVPDSASGCENDCE